MRYSVQLLTSVSMYRFVVLALDEMKIREDLVFDKVTGEITGFIDYGEESLNVRFNELRRKCQNQNPDKREVATHMLTMMVQGLSFHLNLPIANFATTGKVKLYHGLIHLFSFCFLRYISRKYYAPGMESSQNATVNWFNCNISGS